MRLDWSVGISLNRSTQFFPSRVTYLCTLKKSFSFFFEIAGFFTPKGRL